MTEIQYVPRDYVQQTWPKVEKYFEAAVEFSAGEYTTAQIRNFVSQGQWLLFVATREGEINGAGTVEMINLPNSRVAFITALGGRNMVNKTTFKQFCGWVKQFGATKVRAATRDELLRLYSMSGMTKKYNIVEIDI